jgi:hypothetical protein
MLAVWFCAMFCRRSLTNICLDDVLVVEVEAWQVEERRCDPD